MTQETSYKFKGYSLGIAGAVSYGTNPLFALPLYALGLSTNSTLFYRYLFAVPMLALLLLIRKESFKVKWKELPYMCLMGICFAGSSALLYYSYHYMPSGVASTLLFVYPAMVAVLMMLFFHERFSWKTVSCVLLVSWGIYFLYKNPDGGTLSLTGVLLVVLSSLSYAIYLIGVNRSFLKEMSSDKVTFYSILFGFLLVLGMASFTGGIQPLQGFESWMCAIALAFFPTVFSLSTTTASIHYIGSTPASILGALEPITALAIGTFVFGEVFTFRIFIGVVLILWAVILLIMGGKLRRIVQQRIHFPVRWLKKH